MNPIELVESSELWVNEWGIPAFHPQTNQPHLNTAISFRCVEACGVQVPQHWLKNYERFLASCAFNFGEPFGNMEVFYSRKPNRDQNLSKDEALGVAANESRFARYDRIAALRIVATLDDNFNVYPNELGEFKFKRWWGRHIHIKPFIRTVAERRGPTLGWRLYIRWQMLTQRAHNFKPESLIQMWLMGPAMSVIPECKELYQEWCEVMNARGIGPRMIFEKHFMSDSPTLKLISPEKFS